MSTKYVLQLSCGGAGEPGWMSDIHTEDDWAAIERAQRILRDSIVVRVANSAALWQGVRLVMSWRLDHTPHVTIDEQALRAQGVKS